MTKISTDHIIKLYDLKELPSEGGLFCRTYYSSEEFAESCLPPRYKEKKAFGSAILYLLTADMFSAFHKLSTDEVFHFYLGDPIELFELNPQGNSSRTILGPEIFNGQEVQHVVYRGNWQGTCLLSGGQWALIGTTMAPGYTDGDFELGNPESLIKEYPTEEYLIKQLTRA